MLNWIKSVFSPANAKMLSAGGERQSKQDSHSVIIPRDEHGISRADISENALKVLYRLSKGGYEAYLVGGGVRDLLLGREPKDFDVATDATPEEVHRLFRNSRIIGRRFKIVHVRFGREIIEVTTFRGHHDAAAKGHISDEGMLLRDNVYGSLEEDAFRRDFTINALYYNIKDFSLVDYTGGLADLEAGLVRLIGDPQQRFREDPVRMLRAVRFHAKLGLRLDAEIEAGIREMGSLLADVPAARLFEEVLKLFLSGHARQSFEALRHYDLFSALFPQTELSLEYELEHYPLTLISHAMENTDARLADGRPVTPAFLLACLLWEPVRRAAQSQIDEGEPPYQAYQQATERVLREQVERIAIPRRFSTMMREIWSLQTRLANRAGKRAFVLMEHPRFRAAYDFLLLRAASGEVEQSLADWWTAFQREDRNGQQRLIQEATPKGSSRPRRRQRGGPRNASRSKPTS